MSRNECLHSDVIKENISKASGSREIVNAVCDDIGKSGSILQNSELAKFYSMKFPKPKNLTENKYPDLEISQPELIKHFVQDIVYPKENSPMCRYIEQTVLYLKETKSNKAKAKAKEKKSKSKSSTNSVKVAHTEVQVKEKENENETENIISLNVSDLGNEFFL
jgi:hypothetical protein